MTYTFWRLSASRNQRVCPVSPGTPRYRGYPDHEYEQSGEKRISHPQPQHTGQTGGAGDPDREGEKSFFPPQRFPQENDPYDHSGSGRGRNEDIDQMSGKTGYIFQRRQRGVTGEIRWLLFCAYDEPACSILRWAHLFDKIL